MSGIRDANGRFKNRIEITKTKLKKLYINKKLTAYQCADILGCGQTTIRRKLSAFDIPIRTNAESRRGKKLSKKHRQHIGESNKGRIVSKETRLKIGKANKGNIPWTKGKKLPPLSEAIKRKISKTLMGRKLSPEQIEGIRKRMVGNKYSEGRKLSEWHIQRIIESIKGEKNINWKGGITPLIMRIRNNFKYRQWRSDVFTRDDFTCQKCNHRGSYLEAHHSEITFSDIMELNDIKTFEQAMACEEFWNINNGITLCRKCHDLVKRKEVINCP